MQRERAITLPTVSLALLTFLSLLFLGQAVAQEKGPVFWTTGGNWGNWLKISNYPGLAIRTACGDNSTLNHYPVSSTDWQLRNGYTEPMAVVWRVQFFNDTSGKNEMSGWMLEHFKAGEVSDGWNVEAGHCKAINVISVQVKCAVRDGDEAKCYNSDGNPYPPRPDGAFSGAHKPVNSPVTAAEKAGLSSKAAGESKQTQLVGVIWICDANASTKWNDGQVDPNPKTFWYIFNPDGTVTGSEMQPVELGAFPPITHELIEDRRQWPFGKWEEHGGAVNWGDDNADFKYSGILNGSSITGSLVELNPGRQKLTRSGTVTCRPMKLPK
jgi:hypothetical protein